MYGMSNVAISNGKLYNTNGKLYNTNGKDQILQNV
jgi:hypothetical protein